MDYEKIKHEIEEKIPAKYEAAGIYCIKANNKIVYIGKSQNMKRRVAEHIFAIDIWTAREKIKYETLRKLNRLGYNIDFDILETVEESDINKLADQEARWIYTYMPILNFQLPIVGGSFKKNPRFLGSIEESVKEIMKEPSVIDTMNSYIRLGLDFDAWFDNKSIKNYIGVRGNG